MKPLNAPFVADPLLPQRDALLDSGHVARHLRRLLRLPHPVESIVRRRAKYRIGESVRVVYEMTSDDAALIVTARTFPPEELNRQFAKALRNVIDTAEFPPVVLDPEHSAIWWMFPNDRKMVGLAGLLTPGDVDREALSLPRWRRSVLMEYSPERSATVRAEDEFGTTLAFVKAYSPGTVDLTSLNDRYNAIAAGLCTASARSPRSIGVDHDRNRLALEAMPGAGWDRIVGEDAVQAMGLLGQAIATLHGLDLPAAARPAPFARFVDGRIIGSAVHIAAARPDVGARLVALAHDLVARRPETTDHCLLHGDCHPKNALVEGGSVSLIDIDQGGTGPAAADLGSLLARLRLGSIVGERPAAEEPALAGAFLDGYASVAALPRPEELHWYTVTALVVERTIRAINRVRPMALAHLGEIADAAESLATRSSSDPLLEALS